VPRAGQLKPLSDSRLTDHISIGVLTRVFPPELVDGVVAEAAGRAARSSPRSRSPGFGSGELCQLDNQDLNLERKLLRVRDAKTEAGIRTVDLQPALLDQLTAYRRARPSTPMEAPVFPTRTGSRRDRNGVLQHVLAPAVRRANELRGERNEPPIHTHVTPHTLRRTFITFLIAAGFDLPYVQSQVGHVDPTTTLRVYAQVMARRDRDQLRAEIRQLLGLDPAPARRPAARPATVAEPQPGVTRLRAAEKAGKGRAVSR
jgi:integrase